MACHVFAPQDTTENVMNSCGTCGGDRRLPVLVASPRPGSVRDAWGDPCLRASKDSYPLTAICAECGATIRCASGDADWAHMRTRRLFCEGR